MTARKTTPHLKRGPKPKPKPPKRTRGRPEVRLREHPDRYTVARYDVAALWAGIQKGKRMGAVTCAWRWTAVADRNAGCR